MRPFGKLMEYVLSRGRPEVVELGALELLFATVELDVSVELVAPLNLLEPDVTEPGELLVLLHQKTPARTIAPIMSKITAIFLLME
jgi:hypothetical protein